MNPIKNQGCTQVPQKCSCSTIFSYIDITRLRIKTVIFSTPDKNNNLTSEIHIHGYVSINLNT
jgi:hypothetical protein